MKATILRPVIIYGAYDLRFLPRVIEHMRRGTMLAVGRVNQGPPLVYSKDVAAFITASLLHQNSPFEIFNLCSPESVSWERIVREVGVALELPTQVSRIPLSIAFAAGGLLEFIWKLFRAKSPPILTRFLVGMIGLNYDFDASKALLVAGFPGFTPFSAGLKETLDWFCRRERHLNLIPRGLDDGKCGHEYLAAHEAAL
jgi:nucleoside-diphosphate-sugar epimerase